MEHSKEWVKDRLGTILSQAAATDEYKKIVEEGADTGTIWGAIASLAVDLVDDGFLLDLTEDHLIPGLREVNEVLGQNGFTLQVYIGKGNHLTRFELLETGS